MVAANYLALDAIKLRFQAGRLVLVGHSGGAAIAALVAAQRNDVDLRVSMAGNLDTLAWTRAHNLAPLRKSLNPIDVANALQNIPQIHFVGGKVDNITPQLVFAYVDRFAKKRAPVVFVETEFNHHCCWTEQWPALWHRIEKLADLLD